MKFVSKISTFLVVSIVTLAFGIVPAFAEGDSNADVTNHVEMMETEHKWFYWPGWAFAGLTFLVIAIVLFSWWKLVLEPKYRGRKVTQ